MYSLQSCNIQMCSIQPFYYHNLPETGRMPKVHCKVENFHCFSDIGVLNTKKRVMCSTTFFEQKGW